MTRFGSRERDRSHAVKGVGATTAARLRSALEISRRLLAPDDERTIVRSPGDAVLQPLLMQREHEYLYVLLLDTRNRVMGAPVQIYQGSLNTSLIRVGEVFREAVKVNAAGVILSHNHPRADPSLSPEDVAVTRAVGEVGKLWDVELLDHLILGDGRWVSLKERGWDFDALHYHPCESLMQEREASPTAGFSLLCIACSLLPVEGVTFFDSLATQAARPPHPLV
ncbi:MAG: JAB domain-containing protein [Anaerolineales bacterium]